jgi:hypothetical protein
MQYVAFVFTPRFCTFSTLSNLCLQLEKEVDLLDELAVTGTGEEQFDFLMFVYIDDACHFMVS